MFFLFARLFASATLAKIARLITSGLKRGVQVFRTGQGDVAKCCLRVPRSNVTSDPRNSASSNQASATNNIPNIISNAKVLYSELRRGALLQDKRTGTYECYGFALPCGLQYIDRGTVENLVSAQADNYWIPVYAECEKLFDSSGIVHCQDRASSNEKQVWCAKQLESSPIYINMKTIPPKLSNPYRWQPPPAPQDGTTDMD